MAYGHLISIDFKRFSFSSISVWMGFARIHKQAHTDNIAFLTKASFHSCRILCAAEVWRLHCFHTLHQLIATKSIQSIRISVRSFGGGGGGVVIRQETRAEKCFNPIDDADEKRTLILALRHFVCSNAVNQNLYRQSVSHE